MLEVVTAAGTLYMAEGVMGCNGWPLRKIRPVLLWAILPGGAVNVSLNLAQEHVMVLAGCPFAPSEDRPPGQLQQLLGQGPCLWAQKRCRIAHTTYVYSWTWVFTWKSEICDNFDATNGSVLFLLQSVTGKAFLWVLVSGVSEGPSPLLILWYLFAVTSSAFKPCCQLYVCRWEDFTHQTKPRGNFHLPSKQTQGPGRDLFPRRKWVIIQRRENAN